MASRKLLNHFNTLWSVLIVSELAKNGVDTYFVSPGNRNVPIMAALGEMPGISVKLCLDERASAYRALGYAKACGTPGVLVCTSGTAAANYYPALIEAFRDEIPMIVWSADRPPELVGADANQTIEQIGLFGRFAVKRLNLPCPCADYPLPGLLARICEMAGVKNGPVHINLPFREPLLPTVHPGALDGPDNGFERTDRVQMAKALLDNPYPHTSCAYAFEKEASATRPALPVSPAVVCDSVMARLNAIAGGCKRGLVVVGRLSASEDANRIGDFVRKSAWPVFCDIASGLKGAFPENLQVPFMDHPRALRLIQAYNPDVIIQFGTALVSKSYYDDILKGENRAPKLIQVTPRAGVRDPAHCVDVKLAMTAQAAVNILDGLPFAHPGSEALSILSDGFHALLGRIGQNTPVDVLSHPLIAEMLYAMIPDNEALFTGNSLVIRAFDMTIIPAGKNVHIVSNRGVSGIEGNIATGVGYAEKARRRTTLVLGDISFLHDLNSLMLAAQSSTPVIVVVINNRGGRIFERLPVAGFDGIPDNWVTMSHQYKFEHMAKQFDLPYRAADTPEALSAVYTEMLAQNRSGLIEICLSPETDLAVFKARKEDKF